MKSVDSQTYEKSSRVVIFVLAIQWCDIRLVHGYKPVNVNINADISLSRTIHL